MFTDPGFREGFALYVSRKYPRASENISGSITTAPLNSAS